MKTHRQVTAFYIETLLLVLVFVGIILVLTGVFSLAKRESREAELLSGAVTLSQNAAEAIAAAEGPEELLALLNKNGNAAAMPDTLGVTARYDADMRPDPEGTLRLDVCCSVMDNGLVHGSVQVFQTGREAPLYELKTAAIWEEAAP